MNDAVHTQCQSGQGDGNSVTNQRSQSIFTLGKGQENVMTKQPVFSESIQKKQHQNPVTEHYK